MPMQFRKFRYAVSDEPLASSYLRHSRSRESLYELYRLIGVFKEDRAGGVLAYQDRKTGKFHVFQHVEKSIPLEITLEASEMIYNLRVSLDYAFYALAKQAVADGRLSESDFVDLEESLYFPIMDCPKKFAKWLAGPKGVWLTQPVSTAIERSQPYKRSFMWRLGRLYHNLDKHRDLQPFIPEYDFSGGTLHEAPWEDEAGQMHTEPQPLTVNPMGVYVGASVEVAFEDGTPLIETLELLQSEVCALIDALSLAFYR
jgi:hypothetical protein